MDNLTKCLDRFEASSLLALKQAAERETNRRVAATSLIAFTEFTFPRYQAVSCIGKLPSTLSASPAVKLIV